MEPRENGCKGTHYGAVVSAGAEGSWAPPTGPFRRRARGAYPIGTRCMELPCSPNARQGRGQLPPGCRPQVLQRDVVPARQQVADQRRLAGLADAGQGDHRELPEPLPEGAGNRAFQEGGGGHGDAGRLVPRCGFRRRSYFPIIRKSRFALPGRPSLAGTWGDPSWPLPGRRSGCSAIGMLLENPPFNSGCSTIAGGCSRAPRPSSALPSGGQDAAMGPRENGSKATHHAGAASGARGAGVIG